MTMYTPTGHEVQSGLSRVRNAELLISQLPVDHDGRNTWLLNYGVGEEAAELRAAKKIDWIRQTEAAATTKDYDTLA